MDEQLLPILKDVFNADPASVRDDLAFADMDGWDSMAHMAFIIRLENDFDVQFTGDEIADMRTVGDVRAALRQRREAAS